MFCYYRRTLLFPNNLKFRFKTLTVTQSSFLLQPFSSSTKQQQHSFTVNYLIQNLGFSPQTASKLSKRLQLNNSQKPDSVLLLFKSYGFSNSQLSTLIKTYPNLLSVNPNKTILPKFNFLLSKGASNSDLVYIISKNPFILCRSLENTITPCYHFIKRFLLSDQSIIASLKHCACLLYSKIPSHNIQFLLQNGVPESKVCIFFRNWYSIFAENPPRFEKAVVEVKELGFKPETTFFIVALRAKINRKFLWERKIDVYKKWGWSEESFVSAFLKYPWCMLASVNKIEATMNFFVDHMGWNPIVLAKHPILLLLSLEKRVIPRAFVLKFLESKGLIKDAKLAAAFKVSEDVFLKRFVTCYEEEASQLLKLYEEKKDVSNRMLKKDFKP
ncbi:uncharacterized protein [Medicago truncatula]|uniref:Transcription termination factor family protein n=1 Tax=Medicago truncatula TaxID=3880 RepID=G7IPZ8_MEDTR|nr:uncharacterized protein LOC11446118 [Medicago truncatula]AES64216.2 transcription termination factor family protein [Medicago truncatula]